MPFNFNSLLRASLKSSVAILPLAIGFAQTPAYAQAAKQPATTGSDADDAAAINELAGGLSGNSKGKVDARDIVVTGTNIRGAPPTGTSVVTMTKEDIQATGQTSGTALLAQLPQLGDFNSIAAPTTTANGFVNRPNARGLPADSLDTGASTLVLIDGNRSSGVGGRQNVVDLDSIPVATLERVEVNTDGGSAVSGSDAIGGTINFVTRRKYDGVEISGQYGYADDYWLYSATALVGKQWSKGGFYITGTRGANKALLNGDRDFYKVIDWTTGRETGLGCDLPNVVIGTDALATTPSAVAAPIRYYPITANGTLTSSIPILGLRDSSGVAHLPSGPNLCTAGKAASLDPARTRNQFNFVGNYDISDALEVTVRGRYADSLQHFINNPPAFTVNVSPNNPFYQNISAAPGYTQGVGTVAFPFTVTSDTGKSQTIQGSYAPWIGPDLVPSINKFKQYGATVELVYKIDGNFQVKATGVWDQSKTDTNTRGIDANARDNALTLASNVTLTAANRACTDKSNALATAKVGGNAVNIASALAAAQAVCINPYNIAASNPALINSIFGFETALNDTDRIYNAKVVIDGALFDLPAGKVRASFGAEYFDDKATKQGPPGAGGPFGLVDTLPVGIGTRSVVSGFAEINIPIVSSANALSWIKELRVRAAARYDHYTFFGATFNPQIGVTFKPTDWLNISGNVNTSYRAPTVLDLLGNGSGIPLTVVPFSQNTTPFNSLLPDPRVCPAPPGGCLTDSIFYSLNGGASPDIGPQKGLNWSVAAEVTPFRGFRARVSYYHIDYKNAISAPNILQFASFSPFTIWYPTVAQINEFLQASDNTSAYTAEQSGANRPVYALVDLRARNYGNSKVAGLDYSARYNSRTSWGSMFVSLSGNVKLENKSQGTTTQTINGKPTLVLNPTFVDQLNNSLHGASLQAGVTYGQGLRLTATLNHTDGYKLIGNAARSATSPQDRVGDFNVVNLSVVYDFQGDGVIEQGLQLSLNVNNMFNTSPPLRTAGTGTANGRTIGRLIQAGIKKSF